jgi:proteasome assembly chaperone (PAC2) family protein
MQIKNQALSYLSSLVHLTNLINRILIKNCISRGKVEILKSLDGNYDLLIMCPNQEVQASLKFYSLTSKFQQFVANLGKIMICTTRDIIQLIADCEINLYEDF